MNSAENSPSRYESIPKAVAFILALFTSLGLAIVFGCLGAYIVFRIDSEGPKDKVLAFALGSFLAVGSFVFNIVFTWLQKMHHAISVRTSCFALLIAFAFASAATALFGEPEYWRLIIEDWVAILFSSLLSLAVCRRWYSHKQCES